KKGRTMNASTVRVFGIGLLASLGAIGCVEEEDFSVNSPATCAADAPEPKEPRVTDGYLTFPGIGLDSKQYKVTSDGISSEALVLHRGEDGRSFLGAIWASGVRTTTPIEMS